MRLPSHRLLAFVAIMVGLFALGLGGARRAAAFTLVVPFDIPVTSCIDDMTTNGVCSLREAVRDFHLYALAGSTGSYTSTECPSPNGPSGIGGAPVTITLPACQPWTMAIAPQGQPLDFSTGDIDLIDPNVVTIRGQGPGQTILDGNQLDRIFTVSSGGFFLQNLTLRNGRAVTNQHAGGAIFSGVPVSISDVVIEGNQAEDGGGGIFCQASPGPTPPTLTMNRVTVTGNSTTSPTPTLAGGGGVRTNGFAVKATNVTISGNSSAQSGGASLALVGSSSLQHVTVASNTTPTGANGQAGGLWYTQTGGDLTLKNLLVVGNTGGSAADCLHTSLVGDGPVTGAGVNLIGDGPTCVSGQTFVANANLAPLQAVGGSPVKVHALLDGHPALDAATCPTGATGVTGDVRTFPRPINACDAGAYERQATDVSVTLNAPATAQGEQAFAVTATVSATAYATAPVLTLTLPAGFSLASSSGASCTTASTTVSCTLGDVPAAGSSPAVVWNVVGNASASFTASVASPFEHDALLSNNTATAQTTVTPAPPPAPAGAGSGTGPTTPGNDDPSAAFLAAHTKRGCGCGASDGTLPIAGFLLILGLRRLALRSRRVEP